MDPSTCNPLVNKAIDDLQDEFVTKATTELIKHKDDPYYGNIILIFLKTEEAEIRKFLANKLDKKQEMKIPASKIWVYIGSCAETGACLIHQELDIDSQPMSTVAKMLCKKPSSDGNEYFAIHIVWSYLFVHELYVVYIKHRVNYLFQEKKWENGSKLQNMTNAFRLESFLLVKYNNLFWFIQ